MAWTYYAKVYGDIEPQANVQDVEEAILSSKIDPDGVSCYQWSNAICSDDLPLDMIQYIIRNRLDPVIEPLYQMVRTSISSILDKD